MSPIVILFIVGGYFLLLILFSLFVSKSDTNLSFFSADKSASWLLVSYGMIGASLSGVTFLSVPGSVGTAAFSYMQVVLGYVLGYVIVAYVLLPIYYKHNLISIYTYLEDRFGIYSNYVGSSFFIISRLIGASLRLFLVAQVLDFIIFSRIPINITIGDFVIYQSESFPYFITVGITILMIYVYTFKGGIKTILWTDTLQTSFMLGSVILSFYLISNQLDFTFSETISTIYNSKYSTIFDWSLTSKNFFIQFLSGAFITLAMTGLDQDMMQKNLTCKNLKEAQKNMISLSVVLVFVNLLFVSLGALLFIYMEKTGISNDLSPDKIFAQISIYNLRTIAGIVFIIGVIAAAYSSADSALTSLTTSFCIDILKAPQLTIPKRNLVHATFSVLIFVTVLIVKHYSEESTSLINTLFTAAGYTYGPLLGLYFTGIFTKLKPQDFHVPFIAILAPIITFILSSNSVNWFSYSFGFELLIINGLITTLLLYISSKSE